MNAREGERWSTMTVGRRIVIIGALLMVVAVIVEVTMNDGGWNWRWLGGGIGIAVAAILMMVGVLLDHLRNRRLRRAGH